MTHHSHQDALDRQEYERLRDAVADLKPRFRRETAFILVAGGRLGLRAGEICHFQPEWLNDEREVIEIPGYEPCTCGYCKKQAAMAVEHADDLTMTEALDARWNPKTPNSVRAVPYGFDEAVASVVEAFADSGGYQHSRVSVNRRVSRVAEAAGFAPNDVYPHALRATAATFHAFKGLPAPALQSMFGWSSIDTSEKYLRLSGSATAEALNDVHAD